MEKIQNQKIAKNNNNLVTGKCGKCPVLRRERWEWKCLPCCEGGCKRWGFWFDADVCLVRR
jgi:hypothetical protein